MAAENRSRDSIEALKALLWEIISSPESFDGREELIHALRSQQNLASYAHRERKITCCAVNTLKRNADRYMQGGFEALEDLRLQAKSRLTNAVRQKSTKKSKALLNETITRLESQISIQKEDLAALTWLLNRLLAQGRNYAQQAGGSVEHLCKKEQSELLTMLTERKRLAAYLKADSYKLLDEIASLTWLFRKALSQGKKYAQEAGATAILLCEREQSELLAMLARDPKEDTSQ